MVTPETTLQTASARPDMTASVMSKTGLDEHALHDLVHAFYVKIRNDPMLSPIFAERITDWGPHLDRMVTFWSSVALMTGRYHGQPVERHLPLAAGVEGIGERHFARWLALFEETAREVCTPAGADHLVARAERIAVTLQAAIARDGARGKGGP